MLRSVRSHLPTVDRAPTSSKSRVVALELHDVPFPTSATLDGSDAMNPSPDYAAAYVVLRTDDADGRAERHPRLFFSAGGCVASHPKGRVTKQNLIDFPVSSPKGVRHRAGNGYCHPEPRRSYRTHQTA